MQKFTDNAGRNWMIAINVPTVDRVVAATGVDLFTVIEAGNQLADKLANVRTLVRVLWTLCEPEANGRRVSPEDFARSIAGDAIDDATQALLEDLTGFFRQDQRRPLKAALVKASQASQMWSEKMTARVNALNLDAIVAEAMPTVTQPTAPPPASDEISTVSPASPDWIPDA